MAFKEGVILGPIIFNATGSATTLIGATTNSGAITIGNTLSGAVNINCGTAGINVGSTANAHTTTIGSNTGGSSTNIRSGTNPLTLTTVNGNMTMQAGSGTLAVGNYAADGLVVLGSSANLGRQVGIGNNIGNTSVSITSGSGGTGITINSIAAPTSVTNSGGGAFSVSTNGGNITINSNTGNIGISNDSATTTIGIGNAVGGVKTVTLGGSFSTCSTTVQSGSGALALTSTNGTWTGNSGTGTLGLSTDAANTTVNVATGAGVKTTTLGSTNSTSTTTIQSGSGALNVTSTNGALTINSGIGTFGISTDASATTVNIATGGAAKVTTLGSTNGASSLGLRYGTADFSLASATGNVMVAQDTGEITYPLQPAFLAIKSAAQNNVTGNNTPVTVSYSSEIFDQNGDYDGTNTFTAPVTGKYFFHASAAIGDFATSTSVVMSIVTSIRTYTDVSANMAPVAVAASGNVRVSMCAFANMTAGDTATVVITVNGIGADTADLPASTLNFSGYLVC